MAEDRCIIKKCGKKEDVLVRGLCATCYQTATRAVRSGRVTWDQLVFLELAKDRFSSPFTKALDSKLSKDAL